MAVHPSGTGCRGTRRGRSPRVCFSSPKVGVAVGPSRPTTVFPGKTRVPRSRRWAEGSSKDGPKRVRQHQPRAPAALPQGRLLAAFSTRSSTVRPRPPGRGSPTGGALAKGSPRGSEQAYVGLITLKGDDARHGSLARPPPRRVRHHLLGVRFLPAGIHSGQTPRLYGRKGIWGSHGPCPEASEKTSLSADGSSYMGNLS